MLLFVHSSPIHVANYVNHNHPDWRPEIVLGVQEAIGRTGHLFVFDSHLVARAMSIAPDIADPDGDGKIDWLMVSAYMGNKPSTVPPFIVRANRVQRALTVAEDDTDHLLSALASNIRADLRARVVQEIVRFLTNPKAKNFALPLGLAPQRGKVKLIYDRAQATDFSTLKAAIAGEDNSNFGATYWRAIVAKQATKPKLRRATS